MHYYYNNVNMKLRKSKHNKTLTTILSNLHLIGEDTRKANILLVEPIWFEAGSNKWRRMCDIILCYDKYGIPIEVKGTRQYRDKALEQLYSGANFIRSNMGLHVPYKKIVYYSGGLDVEIIK